MSLYQRHTSNCEFLKIVCVYPKCGAAVKKSDLVQHLTEECKYSLETCAFCKQQIPFNKMKVCCFKINSYANTCANVNWFVTLTIFPLPALTFTLKFLVLMVVSSSRGNCGTICRTCVRLNSYFVLKMSLANAEKHKHFDWLDCWDS